VDQIEISQVEKVSLFISELSLSKTTKHGVRENKNADEKCNHQRNY